MHANKGKKRTSESKLKMSLAKKGKAPWNKGKKTGQIVWNKNKKGLQTAWNKGLPIREVTREKLREVNLGKVGFWKNKKRPEMTGEKSKSWKGGITPINRAIRTCLEYKMWREAVFIRDNYTCIWCGVRSSVGTKVILNADHIKPFALYPELRFAIDNGRTLCTDCHKTTDTYAGKTKQNI